MRLKNLSKTLGIFALGFGMLTMSAQSIAAVGDYPDTVHQGLESEYSASTNIFTVDNGMLATGQLSKSSSDMENIANSVYDLDAVIDASGLLTGVNTINFYGTIAAYEFYSETLLTGSLTSFSYDEYGTFTFEFDVTGGDAASLYGPTGIIEVSFTGYTSFDSDFSASSVQSNTIASAVPEPSTYLLFGLGLLMVAGFARRSSIKQA